MVLCTAMLLYVMQFIISGSAEGTCRTESPTDHDFEPGVPGVEVDGSVIHIYARHAINCSGLASAVELFASLDGTSSSVIWNNTLSVNLLFLEAERTGYTLKATIPVSVSRSALTAGPASSIRIIIAQIIQDEVTIKPAISTIGIEFPATDVNNTATTYNHIPLLNIMTDPKCDSDVNIVTDLGATTFYCPLSLPPISLTVVENPTGSSTTEKCSRNGPETAVIVMGFIIGILLIVVAALTTALALGALIIRHSSKKRQAISAQDDPSRRNAVYSHIAEREAVYEELPFTAGQDLSNGQAMVHSMRRDHGSILGELSQEMESSAKAEEAPAYHTIEGTTLTHKGSTSISLSAKPGTSSQAENSYQVLHADDAEDIANQYQELPDGEWSSGVYRMLNAASEPSPYLAHSGGNTEETHYHTLEDDSEQAIAADSCTQHPRPSQVVNSDKEHVYRTLEDVGATTEDISDIPSSSQGSYMNTNSHVHSDTEWCTVSGEDVNAQHAHACGADENPYHVMEVEEITDCQVLNETKEDDPMYQTLEPVQGCGDDDSASMSTA